MFCVSLLLHVIIIKNKYLGEFSLINTTFFIQSIESYSIKIDLYLFCSHDKYRCINYININSPPTIEIQKGRFNNFIYEYNIKYFPPYTFHTTKESTRVQRGVNLVLHIIM